MKLVLSIDFYFFTSRKNSNAQTWRKDTNITIYVFVYSSVLFLSSFTDFSVIKYYYGT